ncbi:hypothetical protein R5R35_003900 [Gryllus longicercus]|uniref:Uncharacterized protein n=1 Tax=Gryllus longicercus TaxID=2509291 RepID=A0AAN9V3A4_9ORTH
MNSKVYETLCPFSHQILRTSPNRPLKVPIFCPKRFHLNGKRERVAALPSKRLPPLPTHTRASVATCCARLRAASGRPAPPPQLLRGPPPGPAPPPPRHIPLSPFNPLLGHVTRGEQRFSGASRTDELRWPKRSIA